MSEDEAFLRVGLSREDIVSRIGEPDRVRYVQVSFRPPDRDELRSDYQRARQDWEEKTVGEVMSYDGLGLLVEMSKAGKVLGWREAGMPEAPGRQGLIAVEPDEDR